MSLMLVAEVLAGEAVVTPGGVVDRVTATGCDEPRWGMEPLPEYPVSSAVAVSAVRSGTEAEVTATLVLA